MQMTTEDFRNQTFVDLETISRKQYYDLRKVANATAKESFIRRTALWDVLYVKDGETFYSGILMSRVDIDKFEGINVVRTRDIYRVYIEKLPATPEAEVPLGEEAEMPGVT